MIIHFKVCLLKKSYPHQGQRGQRDVTSLLQASALPYSYTASDLLTLGIAKYHAIFQNKISFFLVANPVPIGVSCGGGGGREV